MKKVLLSQKIHEDAIDLLKNSGAEIIISDSPDSQTVKKYIVDVDAVIVRTATKLNADVISCAKNLKVIARTGAGVDNVDIEFASQKNIPVCNTPMANIDSVTEHTVSLILALSKYLFLMDRSVRTGDFEVRNKYLPADLSAKTLGMVGFGKIGRKVANICSTCFEMSILIYDPYLDVVSDEGFNFENVASMEDIFLRSDYISIHMPYTKDNHHIIDLDMLSKMKEGSFLINTARGGLIDEEALFEVLSQNRIAGAALDVFEDEPPKKKIRFLN
jgi:D-3-phosphoglycerate dehydrogenase / 2-oxoglutarate reductase